MVYSTILQTAGAATSAAGPVSYTGAWSSTTAGSFLVMILGSALSGALAITPPTNWIAGPSSTSAGNVIDLRMFYYPNNPGSLTGGVWTGISNANGIAGTFFEVFAGLAVGGYDPNSFKTASNAGSTSPICPAYLTQPYTNTMLISACACISTASYTDGSTPGTLAWTGTTQQVSTLGATNVRLYAQSLSQGAYPNPTATLGGTLGSSVAWVTGLWSILGNSAGTLLRGYAGAENVAAGMGYATGI